MKTLYISLIACMCFGKLYAQNTSSPYSIIGLGDIEKSYFDRTSGLGYGGVALSSDRYLLLSNPASFSFLPKPSYSNSFYFEVAARYKNVNYSGAAVTNNTTNQSNDLQFKKIAFAIKPKAKWALSFGLLPFSNSNYSFAGIKKVQGGSFNVDANYSGTGNTSLLYLTNSFLIAKNLSVGIQSSLLFGQIDDKEIVYSSITDSVLTTSRNISLSHTYFKGGILYNVKAGKNLRLALGATGSLETKINANYQLTVKDGNTVLKTVDEKRDNYTSLPMMGTIGLAATYKNNFTLVLDYSAQNWSSLKYQGNNYALVNSSKISGGIQYAKNVAIKDVKGGTAGTYEKNSFQLGYYYNNSYLNVYGQQIKEWGITMGAGTMLPRSGLGIQGTIEIGTRGNISNGLIKENITQVGITISYRDNWFTKKIKKYN
jgi:hypothetical protein